MRMSGYVAFMALALPAAALAGQQQPGMQSQGMQSAPQRSEKQHDENRQSNMNRQDSRDQRNAEARQGRGGENAQSQARQRSGKPEPSAAKSQAYQKMRERAVSASALLSGDVTNPFNTLGSVRDLILAPNGRQIEYVLYEVPYVYSVYGSEDGFVSFDNVEINQGAGLGEVNLLVQGEAARGKEQLTLNAAEADNRMLSRLVGGPVQFPNGETRYLEHILLNPKNGKVTYYVVEMNPDAVFSEQPRTIPADQVKIQDSGQIVSNVQLAQVKNMQAYDPDLL